MERILSLHLRRCRGLFAARSLARSQSFRGAMLSLHRGDGHLYDHLGPRLCRDGRRVFATTLHRVPPT
jgi:hypothetical protein